MRELRVASRISCSGNGCRTMAERMLSRQFPLPHGRAGGRLNPMRSDTGQPRGFLKSAPGSGGRPSLPSTEVFSSVFWSWLRSPSHHQRISRVHHAICCFLLQPTGKGGRGGGVWGGYAVFGVPVSQVCITFSGGQRHRRVCREQLRGGDRVYPSDRVLSVIRMDGT